MDHRYRLKIKISYWKNSGSGTAGFILMILISGLFLIKGCIVPFEPRIDKYNNALVVDGIVTNIPGNCMVKLSRTYPYKDRHAIIEKNATVKITDDLGQITLLKDSDNGIYIPEIRDFAGSVGRKYKLTIQTSAGEIVESDFDEMKEPVEIGKVYYSYEEKDNGLSGLQIYVDTFDPTNKSFYYAWDYQETWEFWVPYASMSSYMPETKICYSDVSSRKFLIESTKDYIDDKVIGFPLYFISNTTNRLFIKYSVLVRQYVLSEETYHFYKSLKDINENTGSLFDPVPVILTGNLHNTVNPGQPVLGNFQVSGASEKRIFIHRDDLPTSLYVPSGYEFCRGDLLSVKTDRTRLDSLLASGWAVMDTIMNQTDPDTLIGLVISRSCFDCRTKGKIEKPAFWDEK